MIKELATSQEEYVGDRSNIEECNENYIADCVKCGGLDYEGRCTFSDCPMYE